MDNKLGNDIVKTFKALVANRAPLEQKWREAFSFTYPLRGSNIGLPTVDGVTNASNASKKQAEIFDTTGSDSARLLAASMLSGLTPPNSQWFNLRIPSVAEFDIPQDSREWLESASRQLFQMIHSSNYDAEAYEFFLDIVIGGQCGLYVDLNDNNEMTFEFWPLASMYVAQTLRTDRIDTVYRQYSLTAGQAVSMFGINNVPNAVREEYRKDTDSAKPFEFIHAIRPRIKNGKQARGKFAKSLPFESVHVCRKSGTVVHEGGYHEFPVIIPRWMNVPNTAYAVGPLDAALPDIKTLNKIIQMVLTNGEMAIAGTFVAKEDGVINPSTIRIGPRNIIFAADTNNLKPLSSGGNFNIAAVEIQRLQAQIRKVMMSDQLQPTDGPAMTATEVHVRTQLIRQLLGPIYGRFQAEFLHPLIARCFGLAFRAGFLGEPPESLSEFEFVPQYQSPLARAQKMEEVNAINNFEASMVGVMQVSPEVADNYDFDKAARKKADLIGVPVELLRTPREVDKTRKNRVEAQIAQQMQQLGQQRGQQEGE